METPVRVGSSLSFYGMPSGLLAERWESPTAHSSDESSGM
jgi:hypothetical protein